MGSSKPKIRKYSFWQLFSLYNKCPYSYALGYEQRKRGRPPDGTFLNKQVLGSAFHYSQEWRVKKAIPWEVVCSPEFVDYWMKCAVRSLEKQEIQITTRRISRVRKELVEVLATTVAGEHRPVLDAVSLAEKPFKAEVVVGPKGEKRWIGGRPDARGQLEEEVWFTIDYKLSSTASGEGSRQVAFYSLAVPTQKGWVFYPLLKVMKPVRLTDARMTTLREKVWSLILKLESGDREPNHKACTRCLLKHACDRKAVYSWR